MQLADMKMLLRKHTGPAVPGDRVDNKPLSGERTCFGPEKY